jgi:hypothetical protein
MDQNRTDQSHHLPVLNNINLTQYRYPTADPDLCIDRVRETAIIIIPFSGQHFILPYSNSGLEQIKKNLKFILRSSVPASNLNPDPGKKFTKLSQRQIKRHRTFLSVTIETLLNVIL